MRNRDNWFIIARTIYFGVAPFGYPRREYLAGICKGSRIGPPICHGVVYNHMMAQCHETRMAALRWFMRYPEQGGHYQTKGPWTILTREDEKVNLIMDQAV